MNDKVLSYGTSGFRYNHKVLIDHSKSIGKALALLMIRRFLERVKEESCLKCKILPDSIHHKTVKLEGTWGVMITASHNPSEDNGIKIVDSNGAMVREDEEKFLERCLNEYLGPSDVFHSFKELKEVNVLTLNIDSSDVVLVIGRDTRPSGQTIIDLMSEGVRTFLPGIVIKQVGFSTTPELHITTKEFSKINDRSTDVLLARTHYVRNMRDIVRRYDLDLSRIVIDCANGVGYRTLSNIFKNERSPIYINTGKRNGVFLPSKLLNFECGSDYVEHHSQEFCSALVASAKFTAVWMNTSEGRDSDEIQKFLASYASLHNLFPPEIIVFDDQVVRLSKSVDLCDIEDYLFCSLDGDADRSIFYILNKIGGEFRINVINGDYIACLILKYVVKKLLKSHHVTYHLSECSDESHIQYHTDNHTDNEIINIGLIYTPYSNGNFVRYAEKIAVETYNRNNHIAIYRQMVPIGAKHLMSAAKRYDISIYFEPNGHGSVLINNDYGIPALQSLRSIFNQVVGDGIANILGVYYILRELRMKPKDLTNFFEPMECIMTKVKVDSRFLSEFKMDNTQLIQPISLVRQIKMLEALYPESRIYVRPSGTENVIRIYIEARNRLELLELKREVKREIKRLS